MELTIQWYQSNGDSRFAPLASDRSIFSLSIENCFKGHVEVQLNMHIN